MSGSVNKVILIGNLGRDPEIRNTNDGAKIAQLSIATSETWKDRNSGERKERTEWHRVVVFNDRLVDVIERFVKKGSKIYIEGALQSRKWTDNAGVEKYTTEVVLQKFRGELTLLDAQRNGPPPADSADSYGQERTSTYSNATYGGNAGGRYGGGAGAGSMHRPGPPGEPPLDDLDDEIPF
jgi:single-strand DNA-binding protein